MNRKSGDSGSRRTPVKVSGGSGFPTVPVAIGAGVVLIVALIAYLIIQSNQSPSTDAATAAAQDSSPDIPGTYVPDQGRGHFPGAWPTDRAITPFCPGVVQSDDAKTATNNPPGAGSTATSGTKTSSTVASTPSPAATSTPAATNTPPATASSDATSQSTSASGTTPNATATPQQNCYASNPPSSGRHLNVQKNVNLGNGVVLAQIPPNVGVYPHDIVFPRESIPHILEHAGVYVGWNCKDDDQACLDAVQKVEDLANDRIDNHDNLVRMARDTDLPFGVIGLASWTRAEQLPVDNLDLKEIERFIGTNSCRVDWEGFCN